MAICALEKHFPTVMHVQHKAGTSDEQGQRPKSILTDLQSEKFLKYLDFMMDVTKVLSTLSKTFQSGKLVYVPWTWLPPLRPICHSYINSNYRKDPSTRSSKRATVKKQVFFRRNHCATSRSLILEKYPQEHYHLATYGNHTIKSLVGHFSNNYLLEEDETSIISMWPALRTRLVRQKAISPNDVFSNLLASRPDDVKDCLILLDLMLTSTPSTAKCEPGFSAMNHLKCNLRTIMGQNTLSDLMQMHSSDHPIKTYRPHSAISNWFSGVHKKRYILKIFKLTTGIPKLSANFLMMFIPGTSIMLAVQPRK